MITRGIYGSRHSDASRIPILVLFFAVSACLPLQSWGGEKVQVIGPDTHEASVSSLPQYNKAITPDNPRRSLRIAARNEELLDQKASQKQKAKTTFFDEVIEASRKSHQEIGETEVLSSIREERMSEEQLVRYYHGLLPLYETLEPFFELPVMADYQDFFSQVHRLDVVKADIQVLTNAFPHISVEDCSEWKEVEEYRQHLESIKENPFRVFAHMHVRYGSNLNGGKIINERMQTMFPVAGQLRLSNFGSEKQTKELRSMLEKLDNGIPKESQEAFKEEVIQAFKFTIAIFHRMTTPKE